MHSLWSGTPHSPDVTPHHTPEEHADDAPAQTPLNSINEHTIHSRAGPNPCGSFQIRIFYDSVGIQTP